MAKKGGKKRHAYTYKSSLDEYNRTVSKAENIASAFRFSLEDKDTLKDIERINPSIIHSILFSLTKKDEETARRFFTNNLIKLYSMGVFNNSKVKSNYLINKPEMALNEIQKTIERRFPKMPDDFHLNWVKVVFCLYYYFYDDLESIGVNKKVTSVELMWFVFALVLERYVVVEQCKEENKGELENYLIKWKNEHKTYKLLHNSIQVSNEETKNEFVDIFNNIIENWVSFEPEKFDKRNKTDTLLPFEEDIKKDKWKYLLDMSIKEDSSYAKAVSLCDELQGVLKEKSQELADAFTTMCNYSVYYVDYMTDRVANYLFCLYIRDITKESQKAKEETTSLHNEEIKTLKGTNRGLTKNLKSMENELTTIKRDYEVLKEKTCESDKVVVNSEEIDILNLRIQELSAELNTKAEEFNKLQSKSQWKENRILELEHSLKYYESVESDLIELQNDNNFIMSQVNDLECLENSDTDDSDFEMKLDTIKNEPILFVGGVGNMMSKFIAKFPNSDYIDISDMGVNFTVPPRFKYVVIYTRVVTHSHCKRVESLVSKDKIIPLNIFNTKLVVEELYKRISGHKSDK